MMSSTDLNELDEHLVVAFPDPTDSDGAAAPLVAARLTHHPNRHIVDAAVAVVHDGVVRSVFGSMRAPGDDRPAEVVGPMRVEVDDDEPEALAVSVDAFGVSTSIRFTPADVSPASLHWHEPDPFPASIEDRRRPGEVTGRLALDGRPVPLPTTGIGWRRSASITVPDLVAPLGRAPLVVLPRRFSWDLTIIPFGGPDGSDDPDLPGVIVERDTDGDADLVPGWRASTRWFERATVRSDTGDVFGIDVLTWMPVNGLGFDHAHWTPGRWHDEEATGSEVRRIAELDPNDVRNLRTLNVVRITDDRGAPVGLGVLELVAYGEHAELGLTGFSDGWRP